MTITRSGVMRRAPLAMRLRANSTWAMLEFVFNGMVFLLLGLQLPGIMESSLDWAKRIQTLKSGCCLPISCSSTLR